MIPTLFSEKDSNAAYDEWRFNCGPGVLCAVLGTRPEEIRPHMQDFEAKGYTNPTLLYGVLKALNVQHTTIYRGDTPGWMVEAGGGRWQYELAPEVVYRLPLRGLMRVQWVGPWCGKDVPMRARYRQTHWVGLGHEYGATKIFDINAMCVAGWVDYARWAKHLVPWIIEECVPRGDGTWWPTHIIEVDGGYVWPSR